MKRILLLSLLLLPIVALAQYPTFSNKQRLGVQTTGDGLIFRGTTINNIPNYTPSNVNNAYFHLDTTNNKLYLYNNNAWQLVYPTPQFDTTTLNVYLKISDTTAMLLPYFRDSDTTSLNLINRFALKLNISDTATMLTPYMKKSDTISLSNRINLKLNISDTTILSNRITTNANNIITINNKLATKLDTIYVKFKNVVTMIENKDTINIGSSLTDGYAINIIGDSVNIDTNIIFTQSDTITLSNRINTKLDTIYVNYQTSIDTIVNKDTINITTLEAGAGINITNNVISLDTVLLDSVVRVQNVYVKNGTGTVLNKGEAVYVTGANGTNIIVGRASNVAESSSSKTLGLTMTSIPIDGFGYVIKEGLLAGLNTSAADSAGVPIWLSNTPGGLIFGLTNKPYAPNHLVYLGVVTRKQQNNGEVYVTVQNGFEIKELHDVQIIDPVNKASLYYNSSQNLWRDTTAALLVSDTASMLNPYLRKLDTISLSNRIDKKFNSVDTSILGYVTTYSNQLNINGNKTFNNTVSVDSLNATKQAKIQSLTVGKGGYTITGGTPGAISSTAFGFEALKNNTSGDWNTAIGYQALLNNDTAWNNVAIGNNSLNTNISGQYNTAIGVESLFSNKVGNNNVGIGYYAGTTSKGNNNIYIGNQTYHTDSVNNVLMIGGINTPLLSGIITGNKKLGINTNPLNLTNTFEVNSPISDAVKINSNTNSTNLELTNSNGTVSIKSINKNMILQTDTTALVYLNGENNKVGILTMNPEQALEVAGTIRVDSLSNNLIPVKLVGGSNSNDLTNVELGTGLSFVNDTLKIADNIINSGDTATLLRKDYLNIDSNVLIWREGNKKLLPYFTQVYRNGQLLKYENQYTITNDSIVTLSVGNFRLKDNITIIAIDNITVLAGSGGVISLTGHISGSGTDNINTTINNGVVTNSMLAGSISDSKLNTITTAGKISNSATTATSNNTNSAIVTRDNSGNFSAGIITASLNGNAATVTSVLPSNFASQTANTVLAAPNSSNGTPTFRSLVSSDIPNLNYLPLTGGTTSGLITSSFTNITNYSTNATDNNAFTIYNNTTSTNNIYGGLQFLIGANSGSIPGGPGLAQIYAIRAGGSSNPSTDLTFSTKSSVTGVLEKMRIKFDGKVGIGTSSPSYLLDVNGTFNATGNSLIGGTLGVTGTTTLTGELTGTSINLSSTINSIGDIFFGLNSGYGDGLKTRYFKTTNTSPYRDLFIGSVGTIGTWAGRMHFQTSYNTETPTTAMTINEFGNINMNGTLSVTGATTLSSLNGTGTRMVTANSTGVLSTQAIPTGTINGSGTINYIPKFDETKSITSSALINNGNSLFVNPNSQSSFGWDFMTNTSNPFIGNNVKNGSIDERLQRQSTTNLFYPSAIIFGFQRTNKSPVRSSLGGINFMTLDSDISGDINPIDYSRMFIQPNGKIGIGTMEPSYKFDIRGTLGVTDTTILSNKVFVGNFTDNTPISGGNYNIKLESDNVSSIGFHDSGNTVGSIRFSAATGFVIGASDGTFGPHATTISGETTLSNTTSTTPNILLGKNTSTNVVANVTTVEQTGLMTRGVKTVTVSGATATFDVTHSLGVIPETIIITSNAINASSGIFYEIVAKTDNLFTVQGFNVSNGSPAINKTLSVNWLAIK